MSIPLGPVALSNLRGITLSLSNSTYTLQGSVTCGGNMDVVDITASDCVFADINADTLTIASAAQIWSATFANTLTTPSVANLADLSVLNATPDGSVLFNSASGPYIVLSAQYEPMHTPYVSHMYMNKYSTTTNNAGLYILSGTTTKAQITVSSNESLVLSCVNYQLQPTAALSKLVYTTATHNKYIDGTIMTHTTGSDRTITALAANTYTNMYTANPVLSAGNTYSIEFAVVMTGLSDTNNANMSMRLSASGGLAFTTVIGRYESQYGAGNSGIFIAATETQSPLFTVNTVSSAGFQVTAAAPSAHVNRMIKGTVIVNVTTTGTLTLQFSQSNGPSDVVVKAGSYLGVTCLGTNSGSDVTDGSYV